MGDWNHLRPFISEFIKKNSCSFALDLGTNGGESCRILHEEMGPFNGVVYTVDISKIEWIEKNPLPNVHFIQGDSLQIEWDKNIDVLIIDDAHSYPHVKKELEKYFPFCKGAIFLHDLQIPEVLQSVEEFCAEGNIEFKKIKVWHHPIIMGIIDVKRCHS